MIHRFQSFATGITTCYKYIQRIKSAEMTEFGLSGTHVMAVFYLYHNPDGLTAAELSRLCAEDKAAVSRTVSALQQNGYIQSAGKKYRALLQLTPKGMALGSKVDEVILQWVGFGGDGLTDEDRATFYRVLEHISDNLQNSIKDNPKMI